jgi:hypothetical protein
MVGVETGAAVGAEAEDGTEEELQEGMGVLNKM